MVIISVCTTAIGKVSNKNWKEKLYFIILVLILVLCCVVLMSKYFHKKVYKTKYQVKWINIFKPPLCGSASGCKNQWRQPRTNHQEFSNESRPGPSHTYAVYSAWHSTGSYLIFKLAGCILSFFRIKCQCPLPQQGMRIQKFLATLWRTTTLGNIILHWPCTPAMLFSFKK